MLGSEAMNKLAEFRNQEMIYRERALSDPERREFWLAKAEDCARSALNEIVFHFRESSPANSSIVEAQMTTREGSQA
jgi:hypothetical protein